MNLTFRFVFLELLSRYNALVSQLGSTRCSDISPLSLRLVRTTLTVHLCSRFLSVWSLILVLVKSKMRLLHDSLDRCRLLFPMLASSARQFGLHRLYICYLLCRFYLQRWLPLPQSRLCPTAYVKCRQNKTIIAAYIPCVQPYHSIQIA